MILTFPYDTTYLKLEVEESLVKAVLTPPIHDYEVKKSESELVSEALLHPIGSPSLMELARGKEHILIITSDHTRPVPSQITLPLLLKEIRSTAPKAQVKILIATGMHRPMSEAEMIARFGKNIVKKEELINHISRNSDEMVYKGMLPSGAALYLNQLVDWADLTIAEGFIEPHFFAGYSGGRKAVLPGIASEQTVRENHCSAFIRDPQAIAGSLEENPLHKDMLVAAKAAKLAFILNVVLDSEKKIVAAFAGDSEKAHSAGCTFLQKLAWVKKTPADIIISTNGGAPLDQNLYQAVKGMTAAELCARQDSVIIMIASCVDGHGSEGFYQYFKKAKSPADVLAKIEATKQSDTVTDQWEAQILARILVKNPVILVGDPKIKAICEDMFMQYAPTLDEALALARSMTRQQATITAIPDGVSVIVTDTIRLLPK
ncbi:MAG: nickel-dependent lactate racemase [Erysipelotrichaceae bacterium]|jgi:nickel-dependent lactate racemase|nr:nickel-dependent lactate racemase [Erysipelotrichaceae bacterium]